MKTPTPLPDDLEERIENFLEQYFRKTVGVWNMSEDFKERRPKKIELKKKAKTALSSLLSAEYDKGKVDGAKQYEAAHRVITQEAIKKAEQKGYERLAKELQMPEMVDGWTWPCVLCGFSPPIILKRKLMTRKEVEEKYGNPPPHLKRTITNE